MNKASYTYSTGDITNNVSIDMFFSYVKNLKKENPCINLARVGGNTYCIKYDYTEVEKKFQDSIYPTRIHIDKLNKKRLSEEVVNMRLIKKISKLNTTLKLLQYNFIQCFTYSKKDNKKGIDSSKYRKVLSYINKELSDEVIKGNPVQLSPSLGYIQLIRFETSKPHVTFVGNKRVLVSEPHLYTLFWYKTSLSRLNKLYTASATGANNQKLCFNYRLTRAIKEIKKDIIKSSRILTLSEIK